MSRGEHEHEHEDEEEDEPDELAEVFMNFVLRPGLKRIPARSATGATSGISTEGKQGNEEGFRRRSDSSMRGGAGEFGGPRLDAMRATQFGSSRTKRREVDNREAHKIGWSCGS